MTRPSLSRIFESFALCISAAAMATTLTIAVKLTVILVDEWPAIRGAATQQTAVGDSQPAVSKTSARPRAKKGRHTRAARRATVLTAQPSAAVHVDADDADGAQVAR
jgi:hypothetical protein